MSNTHQAILYEELSMNAHPALKTQLYDGWVLRFSNGYTNRANSVNPIYPSVLPDGEKIDTCEKAYRSQNLPPVFKLTRELSEELDKPLENRGYDIVTPTNIMTKEITLDYCPSSDFHVNGHIDDDWTNNYFLLNGLTDPQKKDTAKQMLSNIQNIVLCGSVIKNNQTIACGLCVIERGYAGLFDIVVNTEFRGMGYGFEICASLLTEAKKHHVRGAYLQVVQSNTKAINLYNKLGFVNLYEYWYRVKKP